MKINYIRTPGNKCIALNDENIILTVGSIFKIESTERDADFMFTFDDDTVSNYRFSIYFNNGMVLNFLYSNIEKATKDRNYIMDYLIDYYDKKE